MSNTDIAQIYQTIEWKDPNFEKPPAYEWCILTCIDQKKRRYTCMGHWHDKKEKFLLLGQDVLDEVMAWAFWPVPFQGNF